MTKKIIIIAVVAVLLIAVLAVFALMPADRGEQSDDPTVTTPADQGNSGDSQDTPDQGDETTTALIESNVPDDLDFNQLEVTFLTWEEVSMNEFFVEDITGDTIGDQIYERNAQVEDALNVKLNFVSETCDASTFSQFVQSISTDISSGACDYDIAAGYSRAAPLMALEGLATELGEMKYMDVSNPWWAPALTEECTINDKLYYCSGDISTNLLWMMTGTFFNKNLLDQHGLEDPYQLVKDNKWTLDKLIEMGAGTYSDLDGGGTSDDTDFFGHVIYNINVDGYLTSCGFIALEKNNSGEIVTSPTMTSQKTYDMLDKLGEWLNSPDVIFKDSTKLRNVFFEERALFITDRVFIAAGKDNASQNQEKIEFVYGIVPVVKYDESQTQWYTSVGHPFTMYAISAGVVNEQQLDACDATLELLAQKGYELVTPAVFESAMKVKYAHDNDASAMYDILRENVRFDLGRLYSKQIGDVYKVMRNEVFNNTKTFASQYKGLSRVIEKGIATISDFYED